MKFIKNYLWHHFVKNHFVKNYFVKSHKVNQKLPMASLRQKPLR
jgi:hypothetical protein